MHKQRKKSVVWRSIRGVIGSSGTNNFQFEQIDFRNYILPWKISTDGSTAEF